MKLHKVHSATGFAFVLTLAGLTACNPDELLTVRDIDVLDPSTLNTKGALPTLLAGTSSSFQIAFSGAGDLSNGGHEGMVNMSGLLADEFIHAETFPDRQNVDLRSVDPGNGSVKGVFFDLSQARAFADLASSRYNTFDPGTLGHSEVLSLGAYTYLMFAENYCSGVPFSTLTDAGLDFGEPQTRDQILQIAAAKFDSAITFAVDGDDADLEMLARVGKARVLLNQGQFAAAASAVATVPTSFVYNIEGSTNSTRQNNGVWNYTINFNGFSVPDREGVNGMPWRTANDPRVPWESIGGPGFDGETPFFAQLKYPDKASDVPLASGIEARLIEAEGALQAGNAGLWLQRLNALRTAANLTPLTDPGSATARIDLMFRERAFWLYLTASRLSDLRRLVRQYGRSQSAVFPTGPYHKGGTYGSDVTFPVSADEQNNPLFEGCIDRNA
jgi:starch-binding outer membrane protein, SusD/RagB family